MKKTIHWTAYELLMRNGFEDGMFVAKYEHSDGTIVAPAACLECSTKTLGQGSFVAGDVYPDYVLCLVDLLRTRGLQHIVLQDPEVGSHNVDTIQSFVWQGTLYKVAPRDYRWFETLPEVLREIIAETEVVVQFEDVQTSQQD